jgi:hypothetical protein
MRKIRTVLLGKKTKVGKDQGRTMNSVPVLIEVQSNQETDELEAITRKAGYFSAFHWPVTSEIREFVGNIMEGLAWNVYGESHFIRIGPEVKGGVGVLFKNWKTPFNTLIY